MFVYNFEYGVNVDKIFAGIFFRGNLFFADHEKNRKKRKN